MEKINEGGFFEIPAGLLYFAGDKSAQLLHGQLTNDIKLLKKGEGNFNLLLNQKGKVRAAVYVFNQGDQLGLLCEAKDKNGLLEHFSKMAPLSKVMMSDATPAYRFFHCCKPLEVFKEKYRLEPVLIGHEPITGFRSDRIGLPGIDFFVPVERVPDFMDWMAKEKVSPLDEETIECIRIEQGIPKAGVDFGEDHLPQECCLDEALNFNKGCYLGQEIIARLHYKGHVNKILKPLVISEWLHPKAGLQLLSEGVVSGNLTSVAYSTKWQSYVGLGYVPYKKSEPNSLFQIEGGGLARVTR
ncbi:MAG: Folate-binding protein YgfZ [uncultured bacterium]|nr:MAG: Folate-binding protein YgfZ [uncultured bacterium]